jgi:hypothetical protein
MLRKTLEKEIKQSFMKIIPEQRSIDGSVPSIVQQSDAFQSFIKH